MSAAWHKILTALALTLVAASCNKSADCDWYVANEPIVRSQVGFTIGSPYLRINGRTREVGYVVTECRERSPAYLAGMREGDIIFQPPKAGRWSYYYSVGFYRWLFQRSGQEAELTLVSGGDGVEVEQRSQRKICIKMPIFKEKS